MLGFVRARLALFSRIQAMALKAVWAFKLRSLFVMLGVAFGIASLTLIVTAVDGANKTAVQLVEMFGPDAVIVFGGNIKKRAVGERLQTLTEDDARSIRQSLPGAYLVVPMRAKMNVTVSRQENKYGGVLAVGATADYAQAWNWPLIEGRDLSQDDVTFAAKVCLIGDKPAKELFCEVSPIGRTIQADKVPLQVVGRLAYRGVSPGGGAPDIDNRIILPISTLTNRFHLERKYYRGLRVKFHDASRIAEHAEAVRGILRANHKLGPDQDDDFTVLTADEILNFLAMFKGGLLVFLGVTAAIAVLVGGFVLANLFALSVGERSEEIGLKRAMGARASAILMQFLIEASALTLVGGLAGLGLGLSLGQLLTRLGVLSIEFSWKAFFLALVSALAIGLTFGLKPARQAAALDPIKALRGGE